MSHRIKRLPSEVKSVRSIADKQAALQRFVDQTVEGMGQQLTARSERLENQEHRRFTVLYDQANRMWTLQIENPAVDEALGKQVLERINQRLQSQEKKEDEPKAAIPPDASSGTVGSAPAPGGRPGASTLRKPGGPPDDARGLGPRSNIAGG